jgi:hypothetical protein
MQFIFKGGNLTQNTKGIDVNEVRLYPDMNTSNGDKVFWQETILLVNLAGYVGDNLPLTTLNPGLNIQNLDMKHRTEKPFVTPVMI